MIDATELRIGNLVIDNSLNGGEVIVWDLECFHHLALDDDNVKQFSYVPLTEDLLLRFGFKKTKLDDAFWFEKKIGYWYFITNDTYYNGNTDNWHIGVSFRKEMDYCFDEKCTTIHQLQNLVHSLTGQELTLNKQ